MNKYIISVSRGKTELYLSEHTIIDFSEDITKALRFESFGSASNTMSSRILALSSWLVSNGPINDVYICEVNDNIIVGRSKYL